jgi:CSLREA domain-containing protein
MLKIALATVAITLLVVVSTSSAATTWTVTKTADTSDGTCNSDCSLREAVTAASGGDTIVLPASASPYVLTGGALVLSKNVTVVGGGARGTVLQGTTGNRVIRVMAGTTTMSGVTITGGDLTASGDGGGVVVQAGAFNLTDSAIVGNKVAVPNNNAAGGGLAVESGTSATLTRVTVAGNSVSDNGPSGSTFGGGLFNSSGTLTVVDSTVANNSNVNNGTLRARGGGVQQASTGLAPTMTLDSSTIAGNSTPGTALGFGGNIQAEAGTVTLKNTIVAGGQSDFGPNCDSEGGTFTSSGGNVEDTPDNPGESCGLGPSDRAGADPKLSALGSFGGPTDTMALLVGSAALDAGGSCDVPTDQRGIARPQGAACDSGAYEARAAVAAANADRSTAGVGQAVQFDGSASSGEGSLSFAWNFGDGGSASGATAAHAFSTSGRHVVTLTVTDTRGATASATVAVDVPDATKPALSALAIKPSAFRAAASGPSATAKRHKPTVGAQVTFQLSETATVRFTVERARPGRRSGKKCTTPKARNRHAGHCTRYVKLRGSFTRSGTPGSNHFRFAGRIGGKRLPPGGYRLVAVAKDPAGNTGMAVRRAFRIMR